MKFATPLSRRGRPGGRPRDRRRADHRAPAAAGEQPRRARPDARPPRPGRTRRTAVPIQRILQPAPAAGSDGGAGVAAGGHRPRPAGPQRAAAPAAAGALARGPARRRARVRRAARRASAASAPGRAAAGRAPPGAATIRSSPRSSASGWSSIHEQARPLMEQVRQNVAGRAWTQARAVLTPEQQQRGAAGDGSATAGRRRHGPGGRPRGARGERPREGGRQPR